jgi:hypothetical protein
MAKFYAAIDIPSREVAFHHWGWYYSAVVWSWLSAAAAVAAVAGSLAVGVHGDSARLRLSAIGLLLVFFVVTLGLRRIWSERTLGHARSQLIQIRGQLQGAFVGASCDEPGCPST